MSLVCRESGTYVPRLMQSPTNPSAREVLVIVDGLGLGDQVRRLERFGVTGVYGPSATIDRLVGNIRLLADDAGAWWAAACIAADVR